MKGTLYYNMLARRAVSEEAAFDELYEHFFPRVYNYVFARLKNAADADDVTSIAFLKMNNRLAGYDSSKAAFSTWFFTIVNHALVDHTRANKPQVSWEEFFSNEDCSPIPQEAGPEAKLLQAEGKSELLTAVGRLSEREQRLIELRFSMDMSHQEIAGALDMTGGSVRTALHRALEKLKKIMVKSDSDNYSLLS